MKSAFYSPINTSNLVCDKEEVKKKDDKELKQLKKEMKDIEKLKNKNSSSKNPSKEEMEINKKLEEKIRQAKIEEEGHR